MKSYAQTEENRPAKADLMGQKRQQKALREFKEVLNDLVLMLREASGMETAYLYWINRDRRQFVMETKSTTASDIVFQDRVGFSEHFLDRYKGIRQPVTLEIGKDIDRELIAHYYEGKLPVNHITLLPFTNNEETVAITVLESENKTPGSELNEVIYAYSNALGNVMNTYLEISDLHENQQEWVAYEQSLSFLDASGHSAGLLSDMLQSMQELAGEGSVSFISRAMGTWSNLLNSTGSERPLPLGMPVEERTVAWESLKKGESEFVIHFNKSPKRISPREIYTEGSTFAIPLSFNEHRKGLVLVYGQNPLVFKEATKHKLANMVRLTGLKIQARLNRKKEDRLLTNEYGAVIPDLWERALEGEINRLKNGGSTQNTWVGMVTLSELSELRTQLRLEELDLMQKDLVKVFNPSRYGIPGYVGFHSDYVYLLILQSKDTNAADHWKKQLQQYFETPLELTNGKQIHTGLHIHTLPLTGDYEDSYQVVSHVKRGLTETAKRSR